MATNNQLNVPLSGSTGTGNFVGANTPTLITPVLGAATATSINFGGSSLANYITGGTWTPTATFATVGDLSVSYATQSGFYTRIGNLVVAGFVITFTPTFATSAGNFSIPGLPLTVASVGAIGTCSALNAVNFPAGVTQLNCVAALGTTSIFLVGQGTGTAQTIFTTAQITTGVARSFQGLVTYFV